MENNVPTEQGQLVEKGKGSKLPKPNNIFIVPTDTALNFFKQWCIFLRPFVNLTDREKDVIAGFLKRRWELSKSISDATLLDAMTMNEENKKKVLDECGISLQHFYVVMSSLKKKKVINNGRIHPRLIPSIRETDNGVFQLLILFKEGK